MPGPRHGRMHKSKRAEHVYCTTTTTRWATPHSTAFRCCVPCAKAVSRTHETALGVLVRNGVAPTTEQPKGGALHVSRHLLCVCRESCASFMRLGAQRGPSRAHSKALVTSSVPTGQHARSNPRKPHSPLRERGLWPGRLDLASPALLPELLELQTRRCVGRVAWRRDSRRPR